MLLGEMWELLLSESRGLLFSKLCELLEVLESVVMSKEDLARQFNVSRATVYRLAAKLDKEFVEQAQKDWQAEAALNSAAAST